MKVKLTTSEHDEFIGYKNVPYNDLSQIYDNSCFELYCDAGVIKKIPNKDFSDFFERCCSKIRHGGLFIVSGPDISNICMFYNRRTISELELSNTLSNSSGFYNCRMIEQEFKKNGFNINHMSILSYHFVVRGLRE